MKRLFMVIAALMLMMNVFAQTADVRDSRRSVTIEMDKVWEPYSSLFDAYIRFNDANNEMIITITLKVDIDVQVKDYWTDIHDEWDYNTQKILVELLDVEYLKLVLISYYGNATTYRQKIIS